MQASDTSLRMTWWEFAARLLLVLALLVVLDATARAEVPAKDPAFDRAYRLPGDGSLSELAPFLAHIHRVRVENPDDVIVVFLGASPTYGVGIRSAKNTFPASFEQAATTDRRLAGRRVRVFNLAANGLLLGDEYVIAKAVGADADLFMVQLTYQTFDPRRSASRMREPDLPAMLQVGISAEEARWLGVDRRTDTQLDRAVDRTVRAHWYELAHREQIASALALSDSTQRLYRMAAGRSALPDSAAATQAADAGDGAGAPASTTPFDALDPALQMVAISRASENSHFALSEGNSELQMLDRLGQYFRAHGRPALFFLAPMDEEVLTDYEVLDEHLYARNVAKMRGALALSGHHLIDYHSKPFLTSAQFVDLTHTTDSGGKATGQRLWRDARTTVEGLAAR